MPLAELVHYLNRQNRETYGAEICPADGLSVTPSGIRGHDGPLLLRSVFQPLVAVKGRTIGHEALLRAESEDCEALTASDVFRRTASPEKLIYLDRLCRTLHALNYLQLSRNGNGTLFLNIEAAHVRAVTGGHGLVFEAILKRCGLSPENIFFELRAAEVSGNPHLVEAIRAYRSRGYRIAIDQAGPDLSSALLETLRPELVKYDVRRFERRGGVVPEADAGAAVKACRDAGAEIAATHISAVRHLGIARALCAAYLQGHHFAPPSPDLGRDSVPELPLAADDVALSAIRH